MPELNIYEGFGFTAHILKIALVTVKDMNLPMYITLQIFIHLVPDPNLIVECINTLPCNVTVFAIVQYLNAKCGTPIFIAVHPRHATVSQSLPLGAKILRSYTPRALLRRPLTVELQIVIFVVFVVVFVGVVLCLTFVIIIIVVSNSNFRISTTISRIRATLVPLHSSSQYQSISIATSAK